MEELFLKLCSTLAGSPCCKMSCLGFFGWLVSFLFCSYLCVVLVFLFLDTTTSGLHCLHLVSEYSALQFLFLDTCVFVIEVFVSAFYITLFGPTV